MLDYLTIMSVAALLIILVVSTILILWDEYDDGIFGKLSLILLVMASWAALDRILPLTNYYYPSKTETWLYVAVAAWLGRHFYRFLCYQYDGKYRWFRKPQKCE